LVKRQKSMSVETLKLDLISWIAELDDETLLQRLNAFRKKAVDGWAGLSYEDRQAIEEGLQEVREGNTVPYSDVRAEIDELLK